MFGLPIKKYQILIDTNTDHINNESDALNDLVENIGDRIECIHSKYQPSMLCMAGLKK